MASPTDHLDQFEASLCDLPSRDAINQIHAAQQRLGAMELRILSREHCAGRSRRSCERLAAASDQRSTQTAKSSAAQAEAVAANPVLADRVESGDLSLDALAALASVDEQTEGHAAANDSTLIDKLAAAPASQARKLCREWFHDQQTQEEVEDTAAKQRVGRNVQKHTFTNKGMAALWIEGDSSSIDLAYKQISALANSIYEADGGRNLPRHQHPRTYDQRLFDAAIQLITSSEGSGGLASTVVVTATLDADTPRPQRLGFGPITEAEFGQWWCQSELVGILYDQEGEVLYHGRSVRFPTSAQRIHLAVCDRGCVLCEASPDRCEAHHLMPWSAPGQGKTDIDQMALLCSNCHRRLHHDNLTLYRNSDGEWRTRPATARETPAPQARRTRRGPPS